MPRRFHPLYDRTACFYYNAAFHASVDHNITMKIIEVTLERFACWTIHVPEGLQPCHSVSRSYHSSAQHRYYHPCVQILFLSVEAFSSRFAGIGFPVTVLPSVPSTRKDGTPRSPDPAPQTLSTFTDQ